MALYRLVAQPHATTVGVASWSCSDFKSATLVLCSSFPVRVKVLCIISLSAAAHCMVVGMFTTCPL